MKGINFDATDGRITIVNGDRTVATTDGTLVCVLPDVLEVSGEEVIFSDFQKSNMYVWTFGQDWFFQTDQYLKGESCVVFITALPQEWSDKIVVADAPAGADFFIGHIRLNRTSAPASTWLGKTIGVLPIQDEWIPWSGSCLVEAAENMARAIHLYIDDDPGSPTYRKLILEAQQSVGPPIGGYTNSYSSGSSLTDYAQVRVLNGANSTSGPTTGFPIALRAGNKSRGWNGPINDSGTLGYTTYSATGNSPCARSDTTSYTSVYSVDIRGRFGRRS